MMRVRIGEFVAAFVWSRGGSPGCGRPLARSVFRVVVCWFSACCGVMPLRARWGRRVLYQWIQAAVSYVGFQSGWFPSNVARNSRAHISDIEMWSLELQRLWPISKNDRVKLRATFAGVVTVVTFRSLYSPGNRDLACRCALHWDRQDSPPVQRS